MNRRAGTLIATSATLIAEIFLGLRAAPASAAPVHAIVHFRLGQGALADTNRPVKLGYVRVHNGVLPIAPPLQDPRADAVLVLEPPAGLDGGAAKPPPAEGGTPEVKLYGLRLSPSVALVAPGATVILRNEDRLPITLRCASHPTLLPSTPLQPGATLAVTLPGDGEFALDSPEYPHLRGLLLAPRGVASRLTISEFGTVGVAHLEAPPGAYQARLVFAGRVAATVPVMVTPSGAEFVMQVPSPAPAGSAPTGSPAP